MKKVLIIEDDVSLFKAYREMLKSVEVNVIGADNAKDGLDMALSEKPNVIVLDIMLPGGMSGFDVLEQLERNPSTKSIPVIVLTNLDSEEKMAKTIGAKKYLVKANTTKYEIVKAVTDYL